MPGERVAIAGSVIDCDRLLEQPSIEAAAAESWSWIKPVMTSKYTVSSFGNNSSGSVQ